MQAIKRNLLKLTIMPLLVAALFCSGLNRSVAYAAPCTANTLIGLWAKTGSATLYTGGPTVPIWGYSLTSGGAATLPGPALTVNQGDCVQVTLHNGLSEVSALLFQGQSLIPDTAGASAGGSTTYTFLASKPGTFLYEAGLIPGKQHQVAMGMYGALIVQPTVPATYNVDKTLVLSEFDATLAASPAGYDMRKYAPKYFLINGKAYPDTDLPANQITVVAGNTVHLRYVNAGLQAHAMSSLGVAQKAIATDGAAFAHPHSMVTETIAAGQTLDTVVSIPASAAAGTKYAVYDANLLLRNATASGLGGMLTFLTVGTGSSGADATGPLLSSLTLNPNPNSGLVPVALSFTANDTTTGNSNITNAEYWIDGNATHTPISVSGSSPIANLSATIPAGLSHGTHVVSVRARDALGNWSTTGNINLVVDSMAPTTSGLTLTPNPSNGSVSVIFTFTGNDSTSGNSNITNAEYWIDAGAHQPVAVASPAPVKTLTVNLAAPFTVGNHTISARTQDALGNWSAAATITLVVDQTGPATSGVSAAPNPNNGSTGLSTSVPAVRVTASFSDAATGGSNIAAAEGFIDTVGTTGTGFAFVAADGLFNSPTESGYGDIPLAVVGTLSQGNHTIYVHARDAAGNWGGNSTTVLVIEKLPPTVSAVTLTPPASNNTAVVVSANANDTATGNSNIAGGEYFIDTSGTAGTGTPMAPVAASPNTTISATIPAATIGALTTGNHTVYVRAKDAAGNWSTTATATLLIDRTSPTFSGITLNPNSISAGTASVNMTVNGASDGSGGSGVAGGEYWFGATNITPGTGTSFTGLTNVPINTGSLAAGTYTVSVRIRDVAGNWSTGTNGVRTATLTVTGPPPDAIFADGFESPTTLPGNWSSRSTTNSTRLNNTTTAALVGSRGMQAQGNNGNYVQYNFGTTANPAAATFDARFYFNPNGNTSTGQDIFAAATASNFTTTVFHVRYRVSGGQAQVQIQQGSTANANWVNITNAVHRIEVVWQAVGSGGPNPGTLVLYVDGVSSQTLTTTSTNSVGAFRLGSVTSGGNNTLEYFDAFSAKRSVSPLIGP